MRFLAIMRLAVPALVASPLASQTVQWPTPRGTHAMAWHSRLQQAVLLGGVAASGDSALWGWDGVNWRVLATGGPAGRGHFAMAYDANRDRLVVHGGSAAIFGSNAPTRFGDTWEWDGRTWRRTDAPGPGIRDHHAMAYDAARKRLVLFGGADSSGRQLDDTWIWDGRAWTQVARGGPPGRSTHRMVFDSKRGVIVLFGGWGANGLLADTWEWDGASWKQITTQTAPSIRFASRMAYDPGRERVVLFGGRSGDANFSDTWEYDGRNWTKLDVAGPSARNIHEMVFDAKSRAVLLFGGFSAPSNFNDLWSFNGAAWQQLARRDAHPVGESYVVLGPHAVGYRLINHWDRGRRVTPARDFQGNAIAGDGARPVQISVWYPARAGGTPMRLGDYHAISAKQNTLTPVAEADVAAAARAIGANTPFMLGIELPARTADSLSAMRSLAVQDAPPIDGKFPLIVTGLGSPVSAFGLGEYLASHGYVVVSATTIGTASQQVARVPVAIETHTRDMETAQSIAAALPFVDGARVALIGVNFNGLAALTHQMRNMAALAVVSVDGYENKNVDAAGLRASPYYDPVRMRVPYLTFTQHDPGGRFVFRDSLVRELKYADRYSYVVRGMDHGTLLGNLMVYPQLRAEQRLGYEFVWKTIRSFLDAKVKGENDGKAFIARSAVQNGFPDWLLQTELKIPAFPAIPTSDEVEEIAMTGNVERLRTILREARAVDASARVVELDALGLYAFRFRNSNPQTSIAFQQLAVEAYPKSAIAVNNLGNTFRDTGDMGRAVEQWERALTLIDGDPDLSPSDRAQSRTTIETKLRQARRPR